MTDRARLLRHLLREDLYTFLSRSFLELEPGNTFAPNWHYQHLCHMLRRIQSGDLRRLIINVPPRSGKSMLASIAWPMFVLGHAPTQKIMCISHTESLARDFSVARRTLAQTRWYQQLFPRMQLTSARPRDLELTSTEHGCVFAAGVGGAVLGRGADLIVVDDPLKGAAPSPKPSADVWRSSMTTP